MNAFNDCQQVEGRSLARLLPLIEQRSFNGQFVINEKGRLSKELQKSYGDIFMNDLSRAMKTVELKAEESDKHKNLFLETWSNRKWFTPGWMITNKADVLIYHFLQEDFIVVGDLQRLKQWAWYDNKILRYPLKQQSKYEQKNDTWGRCVPIRVVVSQCGFQRIDLADVIHSEAA
jgi:hypothetical protein